jgi:gamma-glutamyltranspeptidase/glutathione hydrolase
MLNIIEGFDLKALRHNTAPTCTAWSRRSGSRSPIAAPGSAILVDAAEGDRADAVEGLRRRAAQGDQSRQGARATSRWRSTAAHARDAATTRRRGDTIYLTARRLATGNVISLIQSLYETFGVGIVAGDTGIVLHNRGNLFTLTPGIPNQIAPGKRPFHTLMPAMVMKDGAPWLSFGVMGGDMQAQGTRRCSRT